MFILLIVYSMDFKQVYIKIGDIKYIEKITSAGHCFTFYDETNKLILASETSLNIWMDGHIYKPELENNNLIYIPFTTLSSDKYKEPNIIQRDDDSSFNV